MISSYNNPILANISTKSIIAGEEYYSVFTRNYDTDKTKFYLYRASDRVLLGSDEIDTFDAKDIE